MTIFINFLGGPGTGKSTTAAELYALMKKAGCSVELIGEVAKDIVHEGHLDLLQCQDWISAEQNRRQWRVLGKYDYVITDSPLILGVFYASDDYYPSFKQLVREKFDSYNNINIYLKRSVPYDPVGRTQTLEEAIKVDEKVYDYLEEHELLDMIAEASDSAARDILIQLAFYGIVVPMETK